MATVGPAEEGSPSSDVTDTECSICSELFTKPKLMPCSHTLCRNCLISWLGTKPEALCPVCRRVIANPKERGVSGWDEVVDALPTDLAMEALVESTELLSKGHACVGCHNNAAISVCLNCGDLMCQSCTNVHNNFASTKKHKVESLSTLSPEQLASRQPAPCSVHDDKPAELFCPIHNAAICHLCASSKHRACPEATFFEHRVEELHTEVADMSTKLRSAEANHDEAIKQLDQKLVEVDKQSQVTLANIDADCDSLEQGVKACRDRLKKAALQDTVKVKDKVQAVKNSLVEQKGGLTTHRVTVERIQRAMPAKFLNDVSQTFKSQIKDLTFSAEVPQEVKDISTTPHTLDRKELKQIEEKLTNLDFKHLRAFATSESAKLDKPVSKKKDKQTQALTPKDELICRSDADSQSVSEEGHCKVSQSLNDGAGTGFCDLKTRSGITVSVYKTDITKLCVDGIVNAANENLAHGAGVAYAISRAAGYLLEDEGDAYIRHHGPLKVTEVVPTTAGSLPCKKVLHAVGPRWTDYKDKGLCCRDLINTVFNCLVTVTWLQFTSLAVTSISSAIFGVPQEICAECYLTAVKRFDEHCGHSTSLKHIHFVDVNDTMVSVIQNTFKAMWDKPLTALPQPSTPSASQPLSAAGKEVDAPAKHSIQTPRRKKGSVNLAQNLPPSNLHKGSDPTSSSLGSTSSDRRCPICLDELKRPKTLHNCGHTFCTDCIELCFTKVGPVCPQCKTFYGKMHMNLCCYMSPN